jgi:hypothetical protein
MVGRDYGYLRSAAVNVAEGLTEVYRRGSFGYPMIGNFLVLTSTRSMSMPRVSVRISAGSFSGSFIGNSTLQGYPFGFL